MTTDDFARRVEEGEAFRVGRRAEDEGREEVVVEDRLVYLVVLLSHGA